MKYQQKDFTQELETKIQKMELALKEHSEILLRENKSIFENRNLDFYADFVIDGSDHFQPGYYSTIFIGIADKSIQLVNSLTCILFRSGNAIEVYWVSPFRKT